MSEILHRATLHGPLKTRTNSNVSNPWAGYTVLGSGTALVTVSTTAVKAGSLIFAQLYASAVTSSFPLAVGSIVAGTSFAIARTDGATKAADQTIHWWIVNDV